MKAPTITRWLVIDTTEVLADCWGWSVEEIGRAWLNILGAVDGGKTPDESDQLTRVLWAGMWAKQRTGRASMPPALRALIMARDGEVCRYCSATEGPFEVDHIHPVSRGGTDAPDNLTVACEVCNRAKGAKTLAEWLGSDR